MDDKIIEINGANFLVTKVNAIEQLKMVVRLAAILGAPLRDNFSAESIALSLEKLNDKELDNFLAVFLKNVYHKDMTGVYAIYNKGQLMYDCLDWAELIGLILANVGLNVGNFTQVLTKIARISGIEALSSLKVEISTPTAQPPAEAQATLNSSRKRKKTLSNS